MTETAKWEAKDYDSNEVAAAKTLIRTYNEINGISDEMTNAEIDRCNALLPWVECAYEVLKARDLT
jgi:hypothetical protein